MRGWVVSRIRVFVCIDGTLPNQVLPAESGVQWLILGLKNRSDDFFSWITRVAGKLMERRRDGVGPNIFQVFSDPTAGNGFGRTLVQCWGCPPAAGSGQPPSFGYVAVFHSTRKTVADGILAQARSGPETE
jgi:hypothetical protein